jgi:protein-S-isoprenylcysteine O-methyltransferase Ste14
MKFTVGVRSLDLAERAVFVAALALALAANLASHRLINVAGVANDLLVAALILIRWRPRDVSKAPGDWLLAFGSSLAVLAMRPGGAPLIGTGWALALVLPGWLISLAALLSLNRRFGIVAANRGVQTRGVYAVVRHPMYLGYFLTHTAYVLLNPTRLNLAIWTAVGGCQVARMLREERLLIADPQYRAYRVKVRFRVVPGLI